MAAAGAAGARNRGDWDGWSCLLMSRLPGGPLDVAWPGMPAQGRAALAAQAGELLAALHRVPPPAIPGWYPDMPWPAFVARQRAACEQSQRDLGLAAQWADQIPASWTASRCRMRSPSCCIRRLCASTCSSSPIRGG